jgi:hypothetical protein
VEFATGSEEGGTGVGSELVASQSCVRRNWVGRDLLGIAPKEKEIREDKAPRRDRGGYSDGCGTGEDRIHSSLRRR